MSDIGPRLRALIIHARKDPGRWKKPKGLSQAELAGKVGISQIWLRQIETGYKRTARADTLGRICFVLEIEPDVIRRASFADAGDGHPQYEEIADAVDAALLLADNHDRGATENYLRETPGVSDAERDFLVEALRMIRREEPFGKDLWRR